MEKKSNATLDSDFDAFAALKETQIEILASKFEAHVQGK
jgi:hypothetical protein